MLNALQIFTLIAHATAPIAGAVALPPDLTARLPFAPGEHVHVNAGYGPGVSPKHKGTDRTCCVNDHYALDFAMSDHSANGDGEPILASLGGTVIMAGWSTGGFAGFGRMVVVEQDSADGHSYTTNYAHLKSVAVQVGDVVEQGHVLGTLGGSGNGVDGYWGSHLHFSIHRGAALAGGPYAGNAVVPEPLSGSENISTGDNLTSDNDGTPPPPPVPCPVLDGSEVVLEETGPCFARSGTPSYWHTETTGSGGRSLWTWATDDAAADNTGTWTLHIGVAGSYEILAAIPQNASAREARYRIVSDGAEESVVLDQSAHIGEIGALGAFTLPAGDVHVVLADNTGEPYAAGSGKVLAFDGLIVRAAAGESEGEGGEGEGGEGEGGEGEGGEGEGGEGEGGDGGEGGEGEGDLNATGGPSVGGCAATGAVAPVLLFGLLLRRRYGGRPRRNAHASPRPPVHRASASGRASWGRPAR